MPSGSAKDVYVRQLLTKGYGFPLFLPEPPNDLPEHYVNEGVRIGDVGVVSPDGDFDFIFNICVAIHDPINARGVPRGFEELKTIPGDIKRQPALHSACSAIMSTSMRRIDIGIQLSSPPTPVPISVGAGLQFSSMSQEGAVLVLPNGASGDNLRTRDRFQSYALKHGAAWYEFVNATLGRSVPNNALYLVTGCDKAASWGLAAFSASSSGGDISLTFSAMPASLGASCGWRWETQHPVTARVGPERRDDKSRLNQCVFLRGFKVGVREYMAILKGPVKVSAMEGTSFPSHSPPFSKSRAKGPLYSLIDYPIHGSTSADNGGKSPSDSSEPGTPEKVDQEGETQVEEYPAATELYHPAHTIIDHLLDSHPDARIAVTHDSEWASIVRPTDWVIPDEQELFRRIEGKFESVLLNGGVVLRTKDVAERLVANMTAMSLTSGAPTYSLQSYCRTQNMELTYDEFRSGPDHDPVWNVVVFVDNAEICQGTGKKLKTAKDDASRKALNLLNLLQC